MTPNPKPAITANDVHATLARHMLADGYDMVLDLEKSRGRRLWDARNQRSYLDLFSCFATLPVGFNHPGLEEPTFRAKLMRAALTNPSNADVYTVEMAEFVAAWERYAMPGYLPHLFLIAGGSAGVENALKAAMDWKVRRNFANGSKTERGHQILHFQDAFHGRGGYTVSLTNTADPNKYQYFARFDWPRVPSPVLRFPIDAAELERVSRAEAESLAAMRAAFVAHRDDIAAILIEPIQAEGGDHHFRPEFLRALRTLADENQALLIFDEVQTGMGLTGLMWAHQHDDVRPDLLAFGKKTQVCGFMGGGHLDDEPQNVFKVSSRINSTWGGNLVDMVRCTRYLEIMHDEKLVENAANLGVELMKGLHKLQAELPGVLSNTRGRGLMCAIDLPDGEMRNAVRGRMYELGAVVLGCGTHSLRFRPPLDVTAAELNEGLELLRRALQDVALKSA
ncbi:MAG: L-lysine 6-transaminase [Candidatus Eisenbacteria bacterium]|uniref:L-lysine-epsilon aminotransferase n=1 Tax=Eiseniibacteriota bacterium TaxID=2212470 RepID=A0A849STI9_UNCEI|nr:L-lysine 6-transaminase [Candidatus Eisenbacteria bacterium]